MAETPMEVHAKLRYLRMSPRKVRLVTDLIRGMGVRQAQAQLTHLKRWAARPVLKLVNSAIANAEHNFKLKADDLFVKRITADTGPTLKRFRPKAFGRADVIRKRTTHVSLILDERPSVPSRPGRKAVAPKPSTVSPESVTHEARAKRVDAPAKAPKRSRLSRVKELGTKIVHRRGKS